MMPGLHKFDRSSTEPPFASGFTMTAASGIVFQLADRGIAACDPAAAQILGYNTEQLVGLALWDLPWQAIAPTGEPLSSEHPAIVALRTGKPVLDAVMGFDRPDGEFVWLKLDAQPLFGENATTPYGVVTAICDVTDQKRHLTASPELEAQITPPETANNFANPAYQIELETVYTTAPIGLCFIDTDLRFVRINQQLADINGFAIADHIGRTLREILPSQADTLEPVYRQVIASGEPLLNLEFRGVNPAQPGIERDWLLNLSPLQSDNGVVLGVNVMVLEITDRKRISQALIDSESRVSTILESMSDAFVGIDREWRITYANQLGVQAIRYLTNLEPDEFLGKSFWEIFPWGVGQVVEREYRRAVTEQVAVHFEFLYEPTGDWFEVHAYPSATGLGLYFRNISDRKLAEIALRESEHRYRTLFETMEQGFCLCEILLNENGEPMDYRFLEVNPMFEKMTELKDAVGKTARELVPNLEAFWVETYGRVALTGEPVRLENGSEVMNKWFEVSAVRVDEPQSLKVAILFTNITDRKLVEIEREQLLNRERLAREESERANRIKDEFLAVLSHELRSPLNPILGWVKLLQTRKFDETRTAEALATIERNAKLQAQLIEDLLDISRIMGGKLSLSATPVSLAFVISSAIETVSLAAEAKNIQLTGVLDATVDRVFGDAGRLQQVVWNLLSNAVKFTPNGGQVTIRLTQVDGDAQIETIDTGIGINPEFLPYVFEYFRQEDSSTTRKFGGLGLGLAIARQIVEMHGGRIWTQSQGIDRGATFTVRIPLFKGAKSAPQTVVHLSSPNVDRAPLAGIRVMIVDDDSDTREFLAFLLQESGAVVMATASASEALQSLKQALPDILVSDIGMPGMDGYTLIRTVRSLEQCQTLPAIALTAYAGDGDKQRAIAAGFQNHIAKPIDPNQLIAAIVQLAQR